MGRHTEYTPEMATYICSQIAMGRSLRSICKDDNTPHISTIFDWLPKFPEFAEQYARARESQAEAIFEEILDISDDGSNDWMAQNDPENEGYKLNGEHIQRSRLRVDARKWMAGKLAPKKYGDKQVLEHTGKDGGPIGVLNIIESKD